MSEFTAQPGTGRDYDGLGVAGQDVGWGGGHTADGLYAQIGQLGGEVVEVLVPAGPPAVGRVEPRSAAQLRFPLEQHDVVSSMRPTFPVTAAPCEFL